MSGHSHGHSHGGCDGDEGHDDTPEMGLQYSLYTKIDIMNLECLNEAVEGSGKDVFKPWEERLNFEKFVESDADEELLFNIPFTGNVKLKGIIVVGGEGESHPSKMRLFKNRENMSFDDTSLPAVQEFELHHDTNGMLEYSTMVVKFATVHHLSIHFPRNFGSETTKIYYIGLRGEFTPMQRQEVVICSYEALPSVHDHKLDQFNHVNSEVQ
ncbi:PITH domain-containing protein GA19395 [Macrosteles quadrilineatus]|uniref:PITH domain-containing protein GA19395 n=1 Tax=Macrosteles quadrilineatus TaxID=74068 RepID=UPI0023E0CD71|nr:PITH domain-containing protein GA19395 [Macrosteles quadrilineatus]